MENTSDIQRMNEIRVILNYGLPYDTHLLNNKNMIKQVACKINSTQSKTATHYEIM